MERFLQATRGAPEHPSLRKALNLWKAPPGTALDLGCGAGRDSLALLRDGWSVVALDQSSAALDALRAQVDTGAHKLTTLCEPFENGAPLPTVELVNASFALPFCKPEAFTSLWTRIMACLRRGGLFSGHFFGLRDSWAGRNLTCHRYEQLLELFEDWELLELNEIEFDGKTATGQDKHWHLFEAIARRS
ncbi:class I SAM-dependent methyltransferase [Stutzerimonas stutzeri]|uniref:class I SAM-dependent methyltransferase n=1 Tax=Stutzerimonas stutzeri TaxID=316 RepID=UPI000F73B6D0|nr:class I SAM-dependent methyltransferase [Stutzerimonas stutzeri]RRW22126.1 class I SAM-dependent methyltransferase [Stutzerimonas stutzeri]